MKRFLALLTALLMLCSAFGALAMTASAANYTSSYWNYTEPSGADYAYWNGKKMVKHSGTWTTNIKWMQASLNWCIRNKGVSASLLDVDGSFGPASKKATIAFQRKFGLSVDGSFGPSTIQRMKDVQKGRYPKQQSTSSSSSNIGYSNGTYNIYWPTTVKTISGKYGKDGSKRSNGTRYHSGIDIASSKGDPCYAVADGVVVMCKKSDDSSKTIGGRGRYIVIYHSNGNFSSLYEHLNSCSVSVGDIVKAGEKIGTTGNSGWASSGKHYAEHLHFGLCYGKMSNTGYDLWTVEGKKYNGKTYTNHTFNPDTRYNNGLVKYIYK